MNTSALIFLATLLFFSSASEAQKGSEWAKKPVKNYQTVSAPLKGYYSIGNNATKLKSSTSGQGVSRFRASNKKAVHQAQKGYYATGNHQAKLGEQISFDVVRPSNPSYYGSKPAKGYYSIGRNYEKLQK